MHPGEEVLFNIHVFQEAGSVGSCECIGYHYRTGVETSSLHRFNKNWPQMADNFMEELRGLIGEEKMTGKYRDAVNARAIQLLVSENKCYFFHSSNPAPYREVAQEIKQLKKKDYIHRAIWGKGNELLKKKRIVLKYLMRLPTIWPLKLYYSKSGS